MRILLTLICFTLLITITPPSGSSAAGEMIVGDGKVNLKTNEDNWGIETDSTLERLQKQTPDWGIVRLKAAKAWARSLTGKGIKIAVVDTGITLDHKDLVVVGGASFVSYTDSYTDDNGHGTHVAGIIGARNNEIGVVGIAPEVSLYAVKVLDANGSGYISDIIAGINWAIENKMDIINLSIGTNLSYSSLKAIVDKANNNGILVVAAAGNNGTDDGKGDSINYPARYESVIAVTATDNKDRRAAFSSTGAMAEVAAPGDSVLSTFLNNGYAKMSGTSMAAPYASGALALLKQAYPTVDHIQLRALLRQNAIDLGEAGHDNQFGTGLIQAVAMLTETFPDMNNHWAKLYVQNLVDEGVIEGYPDGSFRPDNKVTRSEFVKLIASALNLPAMEQASSVFSDESQIPDWAKSYVQSAVQVGLIEGYANGETGKASFNPSAVISRAEMTVITARALKQPPTVKPLTFRDRLSIPEWAQPSIQLTAETGLINGYEDNTFRSRNPVTRAETAALICRLLDYMKSSNGGAS